jgi:hypothetical protein
MRQLRVSQVFREPGKSGLTHLKGKTGTYIIFEEGRGGFREPVYVGWSDSDLYNTIRRHFYKWDDDRGVSYSGKLKSRKYRYYVKVYLTNKKDAYPLEANLIYELQPRDNQNRRFFGKGLSLEALKDDIGRGVYERINGRLRRAQVAKKEETQPFYRYDEAGKIKNQKDIKIGEDDGEEIPF